MLVLTKGNRMFDLICPYCDHPQNVCHDDGAHSEDGAREPAECEKCGKGFMVNTSLHFYHEPILAPCIDDENAECNPETLETTTKIIWNDKEPHTKLERIVCLACGKIHS
jgi:hypothetical protein